MLHGYNDSACSDKITDAVISRGEILGYANADRQTVSSPVGFDGSRPIFIKNDDPGKSFVENSIHCEGGGSNVFFQYAPDEAGSPGAFVDNLALPDFTDTTTIVKIWRRLKVATGLPTQKRRTLRHRILTTESV